MNQRIRRALGWLGYPAFYLVTLVLFMYLTFPFERLKERVVAQFNAQQTDGRRLEIDDMSWYWVSGVEATGIRLNVPPSGQSEDGTPVKAHVVTAEHASVRVSLLQLLVGTVQVSFTFDALGGHGSGSVVDSDASRKIELDLEGLDVGSLPIFRDTVGLPMTGSLDGTAELVLPESNLAKADGKIDLKLTHFTVGDGKAKIREALALPKIDAGELVFQAEIKDGRVDVVKLGAKGPDIEVAVDGKVRLRDPFSSSLAELGMRFKFSDKYKSKNDTTKSLFGAPGSSMPALFDLDPKTRRAKRADGFYAWRMTGPFGHLVFEPAPASFAPIQGGVGGLRGFAPTN